MMTFGLEDGYLKNTSEAGQFRDWINLNIKINHKTKKPQPQIPEPEAHFLNRRPAVHPKP